MTSSFRGRIGTTYRDSEPHWPESASLADAPNVLVVLLDDTGFGNLGCYGSTIDTPHMDALAEDGLRYNNFHVTPLCSPTRASILTGRNHHAVGLSTIAGFGNSGFPNQQAQVSRHAATLAEMLGAEGYATFALGKWHLNPGEHYSAAGPHDGWPLQRGFHRFYGFLPGGTPQFHPELTYDNHPVPQPRSPKEGYHVTEDLVDHAIEFVNDHQYSRSETPFFMYFAPGAMHSPHQAPKAYIEKYRGQFDEGWDVLRERYYERQIEMGIIPRGTRLPPPNPGVVPFDSLTDNQKRFVCRLQEAWAGFLEHTDAEIGRLIEHLRTLGQLDNTVVILTADNGTSQSGGPYGVMNLGFAGRLASRDGRTMGEKQGRPPPEEDFDAIQERLQDIGGPASNSDIPWGWAQVGNTPLRWYKQDTHGGGVRVPMVVRYPGGIKETGGIRGQFHYVNDIAPTILEIAGIEPKASYGGYDQMPITGTSMAYTLDADGPSRKPIQYFEMMGKRGLWIDGWKAVTRHEPGEDWDEDEWELYHLDEDFSESNNLAKAEPERLQNMIDLWWEEARRNDVLPLDDRAGQRSRRPDVTPRTRYRFVPPMGHVPRKLSPPLGQGQWTLTADVEIQADTEGVIFAQGTFLQGISLFVQEGALAFVFTTRNEWTVLRSENALSGGRHTVSLEFVRGEGDTGVFTLSDDGHDIGTVSIPDTSRMGNMSGADVARDQDAPVSDLYEAPFDFTGVVHAVEIRLD